MVKRVVGGRSASSGERPMAAENEVDVRPAHEDGLDDESLQRLVEECGVREALEKFQAANAIPILHRRKNESLRNSTIGRARQELLVSVVELNLRNGYTRQDGETVLVPNFGDGEYGQLMVDSWTHSVSRSVGNALRGGPLERLEGKFNIEALSMAWIEARKEAENSEIVLQAKAALVEALAELNIEGGYNGAAIRNVSIPGFEEEKIGAVELMSLATTVRVCAIGLLLDRGQLTHDLLEGLH